MKRSLCPMWVGGRYNKFARRKVVKQCALLVKLFDGDLQATLKVGRPTWNCRTNGKAAGELLKVNGISQSDYDQALLQVHSINADIEVLKAQIRKTEILAPFDGLSLEKHQCRRASHAFNAHCHHSRGAHPQAGFQRSGKNIKTNWNRGSKWPLPFKATRQNMMRRSWPRKRASMRTPATSMPGRWSRMPMPS